jgi:hypothetical protein
MKRKSIATFLSIALVVVALTIIHGFVKKNAASTTQSHLVPTTLPSAAVGTVPTTTSAAPAPTVTSTVVPSAPISVTPSSGATTSAPVSTESPARRTAVATAATDANLLSAAQLLPSAQMQSMVTQLTAPEQQAPLKQAFAMSGPKLAQAWGYPDTATANVAAQYNLQTLLYHIDNWQATSASISLFTVTHWVTATNLDYRVPGLTIVKLRMVNGKWLYAGTTEPAAGTAPAALSNLTYDQTVERFQPYLKGFESYEAPTS